MIERRTRVRTSRLDPKTGKRVSHRVDNVVCFYTKEEKIGIIREFLTGKSTAEEIMDKYHIRAEETFFSWIGKFIKEAQSLSLQEQILDDMANKSKEDQIKELKEKLRQAESRADMEALRAKAYSKMIDVAEAEFNIPIRKKSGTKQ